MRRAEQPAEAGDELSRADPAAYWRDAALTMLTWHRRFDSACAGAGVAATTWFPGGELNACVNCLDRHAAARPDQAAILWEGEGAEQSRSITYAELRQEVCRLANVLQRRGIRCGDCVAIYLPTIPEAAMAMLACARIGAIHCVVFAGFAATALRQRMVAADCRCVITADVALRAGTAIALKRTVDEAVRGIERVHSVLVLRRRSPRCALAEPREECLRTAMDAAAADAAAGAFPSDHPLFVLHTSGSTGTPKPVVHGTAGSLLWAMHTHRSALGWRDGDAYACLSDVGWITGHAYVVYGPLGNGATTLMFEGVPTQGGRIWDLIERHRIAQLFTVPSAARALARQGDAAVRSRDRSSLRVIATAGEALDPTTWAWLHEVVGAGRCAVIDIYGQTEAAGHLFASRPSAFPERVVKPGSVGMPLPGIVPVLLDAAGAEIAGEGAGQLALARPWPGLALRIGEERQAADCVQRVPGYYLTGDDARRDADGHYWITGRHDEVLNVSGRRLGALEIESALRTHPGCGDVAVVGVPHPLSGTALVAIAVARDATADPAVLAAELRATVRRAIGAIATPQRVILVPALPKTRSGKTVKRLLAAAISERPLDGMDLSTLAEPEGLGAILRAIAGSSPEATST